MSKKNILIVLAVAIGALIFAGVFYVNRSGRAALDIQRVSPAPASAAPAPDANAPVIRFVKDPEMAPPMQARDILGKAVTKQNWDGKVVLVNFWATWCPPCRMEIPELLQLKKQFGDRLQIIGISEDDIPAAKVLAFAQRMGITYPVVMYTPRLVASYGGVPALPTSFLINTQGKVVTKHVGLYPIEDYQREIRALLGLPTDGRIETFKDEGQIFLKNAATATELPGVDLTGLTPDQKKRVLRRLNAETCTCGCGLTISQCRINDSACPVSAKLAAQVVQEVVRGSKGRAASPPSSRPANAITQ